MVVYLSPETPTFRSELLTCQQAASDQYQKWDSSLTEAEAEGLMDLWLQWRGQGGTRTLNQAGSVLKWCYRTKTRAGSHCSAQGIFEEKVPVKSNLGIRCKWKHPTYTAQHWGKPEGDPGASACVLPRTGHTWRNASHSLVGWCQTGLSCGI